MHVSVNLAESNMLERLPDESSTNRRNLIFTRFEFSLICERSAKHGADVVVVFVEIGVVFINDFGLIGFTNKFDSF